MKKGQFKRSDGYFGKFGGCYVDEPLKSALKDLEEVFYKYAFSDDFIEEYNWNLKHYVGRKTPLYHAKHLSDECGGAQIYLKREDLNHTGAHKINNVIGQILLAKYTNKKRVIAETGAGQHGVAVATVCARFGIPCVIYMGELDMKRQAPNVFKMRLLGADVVAVKDGQRTLKDAVDKALDDYAHNYKDTFYLLGSAVGPHPYPTIVRTFQSIIGEETKEQMLELCRKLPNYLVACVGGGSNAIGFFHDFYEDKNVKMIGVEPGGKGNNMGEHASSLSFGKEGVFQGFKSYVLQDERQNIHPVHSIAAGLDYPSVSPEHAFYKDTKRAEYVSVNDDEALEGFKILLRCEGIIPAIESSHAVYYGCELAKTLISDQSVVICLSGRGDKDFDAIQDKL